MRDDLYLCPPFTPMRSVLTEAESGTYKLEAFDVSQQDADRFNIGARRGSMIYPGSYMRLMQKNTSYEGRGKGQMIMSDTPFERFTNAEFVYHANGNVLIAGLGMGMILIPLMANPAVKSITVVEKDAYLIDFILPQLRAYYRQNAYLRDQWGKLGMGVWPIVHSDIFQWMPREKTTLFDTIYFDIWPTVNADNYEEMKRLHRRFAKRLNRENPRAFMDSWQRDEVKRQMREQRIYGW